MPDVFSPWLIWFLIGVVVLLAELAVPGFVIIFFGLGCLAAAIAAALAPDALTMQLAVFIVVSLVSLLTLRRLAVRIFVGRSEGAKESEPGNIQVGGRVAVEQAIAPGREGRVRYRGTLWTAASEEELPAGTEAEITGVSETNRSCLIVRRA